jgi:hopanoid biosynthesis associated radical SAM protein HpnH
MPITMRQNMRILSYVIGQRLRKRDKYPLVLQLEPLYQCNLACVGCGKIQHPKDVLQRRLTVQQAIDAVEECGAPVVSIAGGEPLIHKDIDTIVKELVKRKRFVYLCTNALLMAKKLDQFEPSPYFSWSVHVDGLRERHDESVSRSGVFDRAVEAIREAKRRGFRVTTNTTFFSQDTPRSVRDVLDFLNDELQVDAMQISPGYAYEKAPDQEHWLQVENTRSMFREAFADGHRKKWRLNHTPLFLDFLEGVVDFPCTAWGIPCYSVFGWQRPCYLLADGYVGTYQELVETTDWDMYGRGRNPRCSNCMAHCGYEPTAVMATMKSPRESLRATADVLRAAIPLTSIRNRAGESRSSMSA